MDLGFLVTLVGTILLAMLQGGFTAEFAESAEVVLESFFCVEDYRIFGVAMQRLFLAGSRATCAEEL